MSSFSFWVLPISLSIFGAILVALEAGWRIGGVRHERDPSGATAGTGAIDGAIFGLMGLLLAFSFGSRGDRTHARLPRSELARVPAIDRRVRRRRMGGNARCVLSIHARDRARAQRYARVPDERWADHAGWTGPLRTLAATKHFRDFLMASRPVPKQPEPKDKLLTLPELEAMLKASEESRTQAQTQ
jgi:hypothetical protein